MEFQFALILQETLNLGWVLSSFELKKEDGYEFYQTSEYLTAATNTKYNEPHELKIMELLSYCDETYLFEKYKKEGIAHSKDTRKNFFEKIRERDKKYPDQKKIFNATIRPFVEKYLAEAFLVARANHVPIYNKVKGANFYPEDRINICESDPEVTFIYNKVGDNLERRFRIVADGEEVKLFHQKYVLLANSPSAVQIGNTFYHFKNINGKIFEKFVECDKVVVPNATSTWYDSVIFNAVKNYKVELSGIGLFDIHEKPKISATVVRDIFGNARLEICFKYRSHELKNFEDEDEYYVDYSFNKGNPFYERIRRDYSFEKEFTDAIIAIGWKSENGLWYPIDSEGDSYHVVLSAIRKSKSLFDEYAIDVYDESDQKIQNLQAQLEINVVSESIDWFDVHAVVTFGEYKIPFKKLRKNILNEDPVVQLPNNQIGIIPIEWFAKYKELFLFSTKNGTMDYFSVRAVHYKTIQRLPVKLSDAMKERLVHIETNGLKNNEVPAEIHAKLRPYQVEGYRWLCFLQANNFGGCLADDMGLGKTLQTIAMLQKVLNIQREEGFHKPSLIVSPASIVYNWYNEFEKFAPTIKVFKYIGNERNKSFDYFNDYDIILTTYGLLRNDIESFEKFSFYYIVLDESQMIKNPGSKIYSSVLKLQSDRKLLLTGTPIENTLIDLWTQLNFVNRDMLGSLKFFKDYFVKGVERQDDAISNRLQKIVKPFIFRREKQEVAKDLPPLTEQIRYCKMSEVQEKMYETEKSKVRNMIFETIEKDTFQKSTINVLQALMKLRQLANHPALVGSTHSSSGKFDEVLRMLPNIIHHHKVLIFSSFVSHLDLFKEHFTKEGIHFAYLTGNTQKREEVIKGFQEDEDCKVFLISIKAGGVGLNLTQADYVFILDPWWNPAVENQAVSRAHRIGQTNNVTVYRFISENTIEEKIQKLQQRKSQLVANFIPDEQSIPFSQEEISFLVE